MAKEILIALEINDSSLARTLEKQAQGVSGAQTTQWFNDIREKGSLAIKSPPDIIIIDDPPESAGTIFARLHKLRGDFPQAAIFVVSPNQQPAYIVDVMKAGAAEYLVAPVNPLPLQNAIEEIRARMVNSGKFAKGSIFSFISSKGGLGSTVVAVNAATTLAHDKHEAVALFDMSFQSGDASVLLDVVPTTNIIDICRNFHRLDTAFLKGAMAKPAAGFDFLGAPAEPDESGEIRPEHVSKVLEHAKKLYDHVAIDCTSMFVNECTIEAFKASDKIFVVIDLSLPAVRNGARLCQLIQRLGISTQKIEVLINRYIKGGTLSLEEVEKTLGRRVFWLFPNDFDDVISSINRGIPLVKFDHNSLFSRSIDQFVEKIHNPQAHLQYRGIKGAFGKAV
jgi:pilus assembly protein CpaE